MFDQNGHPLSRRFVRCDAENACARKTERVRYVVRLMRLLKISCRYVFGDIVDVVHAVIVLQCTILVVVVIVVVVRRSYRVIVMNGYRDTRREKSSNA